MTRLQALTLGATYIVALLVLALDLFYWRAP